MSRLDRGRGWSRLDRGRRVRLRDDDGFTLTELLMSILVMGLFGAMIASLQIQAGRYVSHFNTKTDDLHSAQIALDRLTRDLRMAINIDTTRPAFLSGSSNTDVTFYSGIGTGSYPAKVRWWVDNSSGTNILRRQVFSPPATQGGSWSVTPSVDQEVARNLILDQPLLKFYTLDNANFDFDCDEPGATLGSCAVAMTASPALDATQLRLIGAVGARVAVESSAGNATKTVLTTRVSLPNYDLDAIFH